MNLKLKKMGLAPIELVQPKINHENFLKSPKELEQFIFKEISQSKASPNYP